MKKMFAIFVGVGLALFTLTGCGSSPKDEFVSYIEKQSEQKEGTWDFKMKIDDLVLPTTTDTAANSITSILTTQMKDISATGVVKTKTKDDLFDTEMTLNAFGMKIPFKLIGSLGEKPEMYLSTDFLEYVMGIANSMTGTNSSGQINYDQIKGKYVDILALSEDTKQKDLEKTKKELEDFQKDREEINKKNLAFIKGLDKKTFTKTDNTLEHTFTKKEIIELTKISSTNESISEDAFKSFKDYSVTVKIDTKKNKTENIIAIETNDSAKVGFKSLSLSFETILKSKKADITLPEKSDILSSEKMEALIPTLDTQENEKISESQFNDIKNNAETIKETYDEGAREEILETYKQFLTEEQYNELAELLR